MLENPSASGKAGTGRRFPGSSWRAEILAGWSLVYRQVFGNRQRNVPEGRLCINPVKAVKKDLCRISYETRRIFTAMRPTTVKSSVGLILLPKQAVSEGESNR